jgi:hypothetical protein
MNLPLSSSNKRQGSKLSSHLLQEHKSYRRGKNEKRQRLKMEHLSI